MQRSSPCTFFYALKLTTKPCKISQSNIMKNNFSLFRNNFSNEVSKCWSFYKIVVAKLSKGLRTERKQLGEIQLQMFNPPCKKPELFFETLNGWRHNFRRDTIFQLSSIKTEELRSN